MSGGTARSPRELGVRDDMMHVSSISDPANRLFSIAQIESSEAGSPRRQRSRATGRPARGKKKGRPWPARSPHSAFYQPSKPHNEHTNYPPPPPPRSPHISPPPCLSPTPTRRFLYPSGSKSAQFPKFPLAGGCFGAGVGTSTLPAWKPGGGRTFHAGGAAGVGAGLACCGRAGCSGWEYEGWEYDGWEYEGWE